MRSDDAGLPVPDGCHPLYGPHRAGCRIVLPVSLPDGDNLFGLYGDFFDSVGSHGLPVCGGGIQRETRNFAVELSNQPEKGAVRKADAGVCLYTRARKLTPRMLNELVEKIEVYHAEKIDGVWEQRLRIHYNCVGEITIPKMLPLPIPDVTVNTRKGVFVNYAPAEIAG